MSKAETHIASHESKRIGVGQGFLSHIVQLNLTWSGQKNAKLPAHLVLKIPTITSIAPILEEMMSGDAEAQKQLEGVGQFGPAGCVVES